MDSMLDLEQLRLSVTENDIPSAIGQVHHWIDTHGLALLSANQRLPFDYEEAEEIRRQHEKIELKCMTFLAFYAKINLKNIPEQYEEMREDMDVTIHKFSEHIKARRHLVVSFYTLYRHLRKLEEKLADIQNEDLSNLPETIDEIHTLIEDFSKSINNCVKRFRHLKDEADRVKSAMNTIVALNNSPSFDYVDRGQINDANVHIDRMLQGIETEVTRIYESQRLLELELKIEAKMMQIEDDITRCCGWLQKMEQKLVDTYNDKVVGMATVENDVLHQEVGELVGKMKMTHQYGERLMNMYEMLCTQFKRDTSRGQVAGDKLDELWRLADVICKESLDRIAKAGKLFHGLDSTLDKVEDMLLSINKDKENSATNEEIIEKYCGVRDEAHEELNSMKQSANELYFKLRYNLFNEIIKPSNTVHPKAEQTEDMVKMKIFTIRVKLKELDRCIFPDDVPEIVSQKATNTYMEPDLNYDDLLGNIEKYIKFLNTSRLNWESKALPMTIDQAVKALKAHQDDSSHAEQYWNNIQTALDSKGFQSKNEKEAHQRLLSDALREKGNWNHKWRTHLDQLLEPRYKFLKKLQDFSDDLNDDQCSLDELIEQPSHNLSLARSLADALSIMMPQLPEKDKTMGKLHKEGVSIHKSDFNKPLTAVSDNLKNYRDRLDNFSELENMIVEILEFLPRLAQFKKDWQNNVNKNQNNPDELRRLNVEAERMKSEIGRFDTDKLRTLAKVADGDTKRVEWMIEELRATFVLPHVPMVYEEKITPSRTSKQQMVDTVDGSRKPLTQEFSVNASLHAPVELNFEMAGVAAVDRNKHNVHWYKNNERFDPAKDSRIRTEMDPRKGVMSLGIDSCDYSDAGKYYCEVHEPGSRVNTSYPINLSVSAKRSSSLCSVDPKFGPRVFAARNESLALELKLDGYRFAPESELLHNNKPIRVNQRECAWTRVASNTSIEFSHPSVTDSDRGQYEFIIGDRIVAKTEVIVGDAPNVFQHQFQENVKVGGAVSITIPTANIANKTQQKVMVTKDDTHMSPESGKFTWRLNKSGDPVIEIEKVKLMHAGVYTCEVYNEYGRTSAQVVLDVVFDGEPKRASTNEDTKIEKMSANAGESVILTTEYLPAKNVVIIWTKDDQPLSTADPRMKISNDNHSRCSLQINGSKETDSGVYTATANGTNRKHSIVLKIMPQPQRPVIEKYPASVRVRVGESLDIDCLIKSQPLCHDIRWTVQSNDETDVAKNIVNSNRCKLTSSSDGEEPDNLQRVHLAIGRASRADAGEYVLRCENSVGWTAVKIPVTVIDEAQSKTKPPTFVQPLGREMTVSGDNPALLKCKVSGHPFPTVKWTKDGREIVETDFVKIRNLGDVHELSILNPRSNDTGTYKVTATNSQGVESSECKVKVVPTREIPISEVTVPNYVAPQEATFDDVDAATDQIPQRTQLIFSNTVVRSPPQFVTTFSDEIVQEGDDVHLKCCLIGQPEPVVWWSFNTHLLKNPRFVMSRELDEYILTMNSVREEDSGRYSITAENSSGLATCSALVIVETNQNKGKSLDRSQYKTNSKPLDTDHRISPFPTHTTLGHTSNPSLADESRIMQVSPRGWDENAPRSSTNSPRHRSKTNETELDSEKSVDFTKSKTKTVKTYHYSGPSGVDLPGIGYIPKSKLSSMTSPTSSDGQIKRAVFVPGASRPDNSMPDFPTPPLLPAPPPLIDTSRFSYVESSECDYPL